MKKRKNIFVRNQRKSIFKLKGFKQALSLIMILFMCLVLLPITAIEAAGENYTIYFDSSNNIDSGNGWTKSGQIYVYGFGDGNTGVQAMTKSTEGENLWKYTFDKQYPNIIFLSNSSFPKGNNYASQTVDIKMDWTLKNPCFTLNGKYEQGTGKKYGTLSDLNLGSGSGSGSTNSGKVVDDNGNEMLTVHATLFDYKNTLANNYQYTFTKFNKAVSDYGMSYPLYFGDFNNGVPDNGNEWGKNGGAPFDRLQNFYWPINRANRYNDGNGQMYVYGYNSESDNSGGIVKMTQVGSGSNIWKYTFDKEYAHVIFLPINMWPAKGKEAQKTADLNVAWNLTSPCFMLDGGYVQGVGSKTGNWRDLNLPKEENTVYFDTSNNTDKDNQWVQTTYKTAIQGLVDNNISMQSDGYYGDLKQNNKTLPYFKEDFLNSYYSDQKLGEVYKDLQFPFREYKNNNGATYYVFDSGEDAVRLNDNKDAFLYSYKEENRIRNASALMNGERDRNDNYYGFFPLNQPSDTKGNDFYTRLNYGFGLKLDIPFTISNGGQTLCINDDGTAKKGADGKNIYEDTVFKFSGDDDVWVFIDGKLVLDIGGGHKESTASINFKDGVAIVDYVLDGNKTNGGTRWPGSVDPNNEGSDNKYIWQNAYKYDSSKPYNDSSNQHNVVDLKKLGLNFDDPNEEHQITMYYMERGMIESNLKVNFNFTKINNVEVSKNVDTSDVNNAFVDAVKGDKFNYTIENKLNFSNFNKFISKDNIDPKSNVELNKIETSENQMIKLINKGEEKSGDDLPTVDQCAEIENTNLVDMSKSKNITFDVTAPEDVGDLAIYLEDENGKRVSGLATKCNAAAREYDNRVKTGIVKKIFIDIEKLTGDSDFDKTKVKKIYLGCQKTNKEVYFSDIRYQDTKPISISQKNIVYDDTHLNYSDFGSEKEFFDYNGKGDFRLRTTNKTYIEYFTKDNANQVSDMIKDKYTPEYINGDCKDPGGNPYTDSNGATYTSDKDVTFNKIVSKELLRTGVDSIIGYQQNSDDSGECSIDNTLKINVKNLEGALDGANELTFYAYSPLLLDLLDDGGNPIKDGYPINDNRVRDNDDPNLIKETGDPFVALIDKYGNSISGRARDCAADSNLTASGVYENDIRNSKWKKVRINLTTLTGSSGKSVEEVIKNLNTLCIGYRQPRHVLFFTDINISGNYLFSNNLESSVSTSPAEKKQVELTDKYIQQKNTIKLNSSYVKIKTDSGETVNAKDFDVLGFSIMSNEAVTPRITLTDSDERTVIGLASDYNIEGYTNSINANQWDIVKIDLAKLMKTNSSFNKESIESIKIENLNTGTTYITNLYMGSTEIDKNQDVSELFVNNTSEYKEAGNVNYYHKSGGTSTIKSTTAKGEFDLKDSESALFFNKFRTGSNIKVTENGYYIDGNDELQTNLTQKYDVTWNANSDGIGTNGGNNTTEVEATLVKLEGMKLTTRTQISYTNTVKVGEIKLSKSLTELAQNAYDKLSNEDKSKSNITFRIKFTDVFGTEGNRPRGNLTYFINGDTNPNTASLINDDYYEITIVPGTEVSIKGIPVLTKYTIEEVKNTEGLDYKVDEIISSNVDPDIDENDGNVSGIIDSGKIDSTSYTNTIKAGKISILKVDKDDNSIKLRGVTFELKKVKLKEGSTDEYEVDETFAPVILTTDSNGETSCEGLLDGTYQITELTTNEGYLLLNKPIIQTLPYKYEKGWIVNGSEAPEAGETSEVTITIANQKAFSLPSTGLKGISLYLSIGILIMLSAGVLCFITLKKSKKEI